MREDVVRELGLLTLGSRLKRLGERMQADVSRIAEVSGLPVQAAQYPLLGALDRYGQLTVNELADAVGLSQPAVTRSVAKLEAAGLVETGRIRRDQRHKTVALTPAGREVMAESKRRIWPHIEAAVTGLCADLSGPLLGQLGGLEQGMAAASLEERIAASMTSGLTIQPYSEQLAPAFHDINAQWIEAMFTLEPTDREVLQNPRARIIEPGGDILFVQSPQLGVVGACALQKTGERQFELTKMGVLERARGLKAGELLLRAVVRRAGELGADKLYLLTNSKCASAIHLYEKVGFVHDAEIMRDFGARYERCNVAMRYRPPG